MIVKSFHCTWTWMGESIPKIEWNKVSFINQRRSHKSLYEKVPNWLQEAKLSYQGEIITNHTINILRTRRPPMKNTQKPFLSNYPHLCFPRCNCDCTENSSKRTWRHQIFHLIWSCTPRKIIFMIMKNSKKKKKKNAGITF